MLFYEQHTYYRCGGTGLYVGKNIWFGWTLWICNEPTCRSYYTNKVMQ